MAGSVVQGHFPHGLTRIASHPQRPSPNGRMVALPPHLARFTTGSGQALPADVRQQMETFFHTSFADVRVHVSPHATSIGAVAFTHGSNIHFAPGHYAPDTQRGRQLLVHELAHVVQQRTGRVQNPFGSGVAVVQDVMLEAEAERFAQRAASIVVQRATSNPYSKQYTTNRDSKNGRYEPYADPDARRSSRLASKGVGVAKPRPTYVDKHGTKYWTGSRDLGFSPATLTHFAPTKANGCAICGGVAQSLDHIESFADRQSGLESVKYCAKGSHFSGVPLDDAVTEYNDLTNLRWTCTACNSSKSGTKGLYEPTKYVGPCPGRRCSL